MSSWWEPFVCCFFYLCESSLQFPVFRQSCPHNDEALVIGHAPKYLTYALSALILTIISMFGVLSSWSCSGVYQVGSEMWQNLDWDWSPFGFF